MPIRFNPQPGRARTVARLNHKCISANVGGPAIGISAVRQSRAWDVPRGRSAMRVAGGYTPSLACLRRRGRQAPRIGPGGAPAKIGSNFCTDPKSLCCRRAGQLGYVRLILCGQAALQLGFTDPPPEIGRSKDVDGIVLPADWELFIAGMMRPHMGAFLGDFRHPDRIARRVETVERGRVAVQLVAEHQHQATRAGLGMKVHAGCRTSRASVSS